MTSLARTLSLRGLAGLLPCIALAAAMSLAPSLTPFAGDGFDGAAHAKSDKAGGKGGDKARGKSGEKANGKAAKSGAKSKSAKSTAKGQAKKLAKATEGEIGSPLHPSEMGKWNASNANQAALDAHIRNGNFNGTIGALAQFQLAARAAAGEELSEAELAALDGFVDPETGAISDQDLADFLNAEATETDPQFSVVDGVVSCDANCDEVDLAAAQAEADAEAARLAEEARQAALDGFLSDSEQRIIDESNKTLSPERTEDLLDELARRLGVTRTAEEEEETAAADTVYPDTSAI